MRSLSVRELRAALPDLEQVLSREGEVTVTRHGQPIAKLVPIQTVVEMPSLKEFRESMPRMEIPSEVLLREERDER